MQRIIFLAVLIIGIASCTLSSKNHSEQNNLSCTDASCPDRSDSSSLIRDVIQGENWEFILSGEGWEPLPPSDDTIKVVFFNQTHNTIVFFAKDATQQTSTQYIIDALRAFKAAGTTIQTAKQITINDNEFILVSAHGDIRRIWTWITVKNNFGYVFTCAVKEDDGGLADQQLCQDIVDTLQIDG